MDEQNHESCENVKKGKGNKYNGLTGKMLTCMFSNGVFLQFFTSK